jgi:excisionase family DNA binding protein
MSDTFRINRRTPFNLLPEYLSPDEFRAYTGLARSTVYDLLRRQQIPHRKFGRCIRIHKSVLQPSATAAVE